MENTSKFIIVYDKFLLHVTSQPYMFELVRFWCLPNSYFNFSSNNSSYSISIANLFKVLFIMFTVCGFKHLNKNLSQQYINCIASYVATI